jgi:hypothetical protein
LLLIIVTIQRGVSAVPRSAAVLAVALAVLGLVIIAARLLEPSFGPATGFVVWLIFLFVVLLVANRYGMFEIRDGAIPHQSIGGRIVWLSVGAAALAIGGGLLLQPVLGDATWSVMALLLTGAFAIATRRFRAPVPPAPGGARPMHRRPLFWLMFVGVLAVVIVANVIAAMLIPRT